MTVDFRGVDLQEMNGVNLDTLAFRQQLMRVSEQLQSDEVDMLTFLFNKKLPLAKRLRIKEGYQLFAALEQKTVLTKDKYKGVLINMFQTIGREPEVSVAEFEKGVVESRRVLSLSASPPVAASMEAPPDHLEDAYSKCLISLSNSLACEDGSLQKVVYMCPQLPLKDLELIEDGHTLFRKLEEKGLICCWCLRYLYVCFLAAERQDLCGEVERHNKLAEQTHLQISTAEPAESRLPFRRIRHWISSPQEPNSAVVGDERDSPYTRGDQRSSHTTCNRIAVFDHKLYSWMEIVLSSKVIFAILAMAILLNCLLTIVNFPLDQSRCNNYTATHNMLTKLTVFGIVPSYVIWRVSGTMRISMKKLKSCKLLNRAWTEDYCKVFERLICHLSSGAEYNDLQGVRTVEKVNSLLAQKLLFVVVISIVLSAVSAIGFFLLHVVSWYTFSGMTDTLSRCLCLVMILASFTTNALVGVVLSLYLFEMRVRHYLLYVIHFAGKKVRPLCEDARQLKKALDERWWEMSAALKVISWLYIAVLASSLYFNAPFFCAGGKVISLTEEELVDLPRWWLFWVLISFVGYLLAYGYWFFIYGRIVALVALVLDLFFVLFVRVGSNSYPKWAGLTQIVIVLCPVALTLSTHYIACVHIWLQSYLRLKPPRQDSQDVLPVLLVAIRKPLFVLNFAMLLSLVTLSVCALVMEYQSLTTLSNSTDF